MISTIENNLLEQPTSQQFMSQVWPLLRGKL